MARRTTFEDWLGDLRELAREELSVDLEEIEGYDEDTAEDRYREGDKPKHYLRELTESEEHEEDLTELMREL